MRIVDIRELSVPISRYADPSVPSGGLTTSVVAVITEVSRDGKPIVGYGFASIDRFAQGGLIRERFAPRLLAARDIDLMDDAGTNLDPSRAWKGRPASRLASPSELHSMVLTGPVTAYLGRRYDIGAG
jgi:D(-)-tartrate dehydratase